MYIAETEIQGVAPLLHNRYPVHPVNGGRVSGERDYSEEWKAKMYVRFDGEFYQPAVSIEVALQSGAKQFRISGKRGATFFQLFKAAVFVEPDEIPMGIKLPEQVTEDPDQEMYVDRRPVRPPANRNSRIVRLRPAFKPGWKLEFRIQVLDDQIPLERLNEILIYAGHFVGLGDYRPRFGRFILTKFKRA